MRKLRTISNQHLEIIKSISKYKTLGLNLDLGNNPTLHIGFDTENDISFDDKYPLSVQMFGILTMEINNNIVEVEEYSYYCDQYLTKWLYRRTQPPKMCTIINRLKIPKDVLQVVTKIVWCCHYAKADIFALLGRGSSADYYYRSVGKTINFSNKASESNWLTGATMVYKKTLDRDNPKKLCQVTTHNVRIQSLDSNSFNILSKGGLGKLGDKLGCKKIVLPEGMIKKMKSLQIEKPELFKNYGMRDAEISARYSIYHYKTLQKLCYEMWKDLGSDGDSRARVKSQILNQVSTLPGLTELLFSAKMPNIKPQSKKLNDKNNYEMFTLNNAFKNCYFGGIQELVMFGKLDGAYYDVDLSSAYPTALCLIPTFELDEIKYITNLDITDIYDMWEKDRVDCLNKYLGVVRIKANLGAMNIKTPFFSTRVKMDVDTKICRVLEDESPHYVPLVEIFFLFEYMDLIKHEIFYPHKKAFQGRRKQLLNVFFQVSDAYILDKGKTGLSDKDYPFLPFFKNLIKRRNGAKKTGNKDLEIVYKLLANSLTGKLGQGLTNKKVFDWRTNKTVVMKPCKITNSILATTLTATIRGLISMVEGVITKTLNGNVAQIATDGVTTNVPFEPISKLFEMKSIMLKPYIEMSKELNGDSKKKWLSNKKGCDGIFMLARNWSIGIKKLEGYQIINQPGKLPRYLTAEEHLKIVQETTSKTNGNCGIIKYDENRLSTTREIRNNKNQLMVYNKTIQKQIDISNTDIKRILLPPDEVGGYQRTICYKNVTDFKELNKRKKLLINYKNLSDEEKLLFDEYLEISKIKNLTERKLGRKKCLDKYVMLKPKITRSVLRRKLNRYVEMSTQQTIWIKAIKRHERQQLYYLNY